MPAAESSNASPAKAANKVSASDRCAADDATTASIVRTSVTGCDGSKAATAARTWRPRPDAVERLVAYVGRDAHDGRPVVCRDRKVDPFSERAGPVAALTPERLRERQAD